MGTRPTHDSATSCTMCGCGNRRGVVTTTRGCFISCHTYRTHFPTGTNSESNYTSPLGTNRKHCFSFSLTEAAITCTRLRLNPRTRYASYPFHVAGTPFAGCCASSMRVVRTQPRARSCAAWLEAKQQKSGGGFPARCIAGPRASRRLSTGWTLSPRPLAWCPRSSRTTHGR